MAYQSEYPFGAGGAQVDDSPQPNTWRGYRIDRISELDTSPIYAPDMPIEYAEKFADLLALWLEKIPGNKLRMRYYNGKNKLKDFGISIPPKLLNVETVVGWPKKAVDEMATRSRFDGFTATDPQVQADLNALARRSALKRKYRMGVQSELIHSCCFATVGMTDAGVAVDLFSAEDAAARWDESLGQIAYGMVITDYRDGMPSEVRLYTDNAVVDAWQNDSGFWQWSEEPYIMGRPAMEALIYRPTYDKPFGQSRITKAVMSITDSAVRESLRTEISAEFFTSPQKYLLGADRDAFEETTKWEAYIGNIFAVGRNEDGDVPQFGQLSQGSMAPHTEYMRTLAARFSGETNVPISSLGVIHDNPSSAEAIYAASEPLIIECEDLNDGNRDTLYNVACMALAAQYDVPVAELTELQRDFTPNFRNPAMPSVVSQADAMIKVASVVPGFAGTDTFFEQIGFREDMRRKVQNEVQRGNMNAALSAILGS